MRHNRTREHNGAMRKEQTQQVDTTPSGRPAMHVISTLNDSRMCQPSLSAWWGVHFGERREPLNRHTTPFAIETGVSHRFRRTPGRYNPLETTCHPCTQVTTHSRRYQLPSGAWRGCILENRVEPLNTHTMPCAIETGVTHRRTRTIFDTIRHVCSSLKTPGGTSSPKVLGGVCILRAPAAQTTQPQRQLLFSVRSRRKTEHLSSSLWEGYSKFGVDTWC